MDHIDMAQYGYQYQYLEGKRAMGNYVDIN